MEQDIINFIKWKMNYIEITILQILLIYLKVLKNIIRMNYLKL